MINMELWEKDIIEWINCSQLLKEPVKNTTELQDGIFYSQFLKLIKWKKYEDNSNQEDLILKFLEDKYPSFKVNKDDDTEHLYVASLLLAHLSRTITAIHDLYNVSSLKYNMFDVLKDETQIRVKVFLENVLPLGREITKETLMEIIMEIEDTSNIPRTPVAGVSHSPATCSARSKKIRTERIRELRELKSNLAVERFTNADLQEDIRMQQEKIQKLQKKLDEKSEQVKTLQEEQMKQNTPKPSRSKEDISQEDYYKKYINDLTSQMNKQQDEIDKLEEENDTLSKKLSSLQRTSLQYEENFAISERSLETLSSKIESKDRELVELRILNEELRAYIKELNKNSKAEQSFEVEDVPLSMISRRSLNTSEALSSVIEIQLQEAKEESAILNAQVDTLKGKLNVLTKDYNTVIESNRDLQEKVKTLDQLQAKLNNAQKELDILNTDITNLQSEKMSFVAQNENLKNLLLSNEKKLSEKEQSIAILNIELDNLKLEVTKLHELFQNEKITSEHLNISLMETKSQVAEHLAHINKLTDERNSYKSSIENYSKNIKDIFHCDQFIQIPIDNLDNLTLDDLTKHLETMLHNYSTVCTSYKCDIEKLKAAVEETNKNLLEQQLTITTLEERNKQNLEEIRGEKHILEQNLREISSNLFNKEQLLKSLMTRLEDIQDVNKDLKSIKEITQQSFAEYQENIKLMFEKLQHNYQTLNHEFHQVQQEKEEFECNFNRTKSKLSDIQTRNAILEENLLENQKIISALEEHEKILSNELNECKQDVLQVKKTNQELEEQYAMMKTEANNNLESLKSENAKISYELKDVTDNLNLLQKKMNDTNEQMELKQAEINKLRLDVSFLREEKENLIYSHKEELNAKDKEINSKEGAIITLEKSLHESSSKIKELQEVKNSQDICIVSKEAELDVLKLEKAEVSFQLIKVTDNLKLMQEEMNDMNKQMMLKRKEINNLHSDVSLLREEKEKLICTHKEELDAKHKEIEVKEEALITLRMKMDKMASETSSIIKDLEEVKISQGATMTTQEAALESLKSENAKISLELKNATDSLNLLQEKMNDTNIQMELKQKEINNLHSNVSLLRKEKENLMCIHLKEIDTTLKEMELKEKAIITLQMKMAKMATETSSIIKDLQEEKISQGAVITSQAAELETLKLENAELLQKIKDDYELQIKQLLSHKEAKDKELRIKKEALIALQAKMDNLKDNASATEKKMNEVIANLQEVRSSQDAVLATQEAALKEKCLHIEELQEQFDSSKEILNKELENTKLSLRECQSNLLDVQNQINDKNKTIADQNAALAELQETLKKINAELETNKEYCKLMDARQAEIVKLCEELEQPTKNLNSIIMEMCSSFDFLGQNLEDVSQYDSTCIDNKTANILNTIKMTIDQLHKSQEVISHLSCANAELNKTLAEQKILLENSVKNKEEICGLKNKIQELEVIAEKRNDYLKNLIKSKESLKESLHKVFASRNDLDNILTSSKQKWDEILAKFQDILHIESPVCDEFRQLQDERTNLANALFKREMDNLENIKTISNILWKNFLWTEQKLRDTYLCSVHEKECLDVLTNAEDQFSDEKMIIDAQLKKQEALRIDVIKSEEQIDSFTNLAICYENNLKSGKIKNQTETEKKLHSQISQLMKEGKDFKNKIDSMRTRNVKLEKNIDDLRAEIKKLKSTETASMEVSSKEVESLKEELEQLRQQNLQLHEEKNESMKIAKQKLESQLKEVHTSYERKLEDVKQKMKTAYNEQKSKLNKDQEKIIREKLQSQMETMCQKQREELNRYKAHVGELSSQLWSVGEKLLIEQQHKQDAMQRCKELQTKLREVEADQAVATISRKTCTMSKQEMLPPESREQGAQKMTTLITEETIERKHSIRNMQAMGNMFKTEDEDEVFDNVYLADMKRGNCLPSTDVDRLSILQMRNSLCKPHLKSSYPAEMQFLPLTLTEEEIKSGSPMEETFNDSLSQSLLPEQKTKKKDRSQTSYKKPGPPTPSKNGGRLSLQGNELKSPSLRILRERNVDRRVTTTPHSIRNIFSLKRQDENASSTPKGRRLSSLFRKSRIQVDK